MVTLLGFGFILTNVACLEVFMPDLIGPVCLPGELQQLTKHHIDSISVLGTFMALL
jgi:hypothetical protein